MIRLERLDLRRWGPFTDHELAFARGGGRLHLVYGANAAGKSTMRRALAALLHGVPARTVDAHVHAYAELRVGARLRTDGGIFEVVRRKANARTLLDPDGVAYDDDPIAAALGGLGLEGWQNLFEVTHDTLVAGGEALLAGRGDVGESLFAAAAGTAHLHEQLHALEEQAEAIFKPRGRLQPLNAAIAAHADARKRELAATIRPAQADEQRRAVAGAERRMAELAADLRGLEADAARLRRLKAVKPPLARHADLCAQRAALGDPPALAADAPERRQAAQAARDTAARAEALARAKHSELTTRRAALPAPQGILREAAAIQAVHAQLAAIEQGRDERAGLDSEAIRLEQLVSALLPRIGGELRIEDLEAHAAWGVARPGLDECLRRQVVVAEQLRAAQDREAAAARRLDAVERTLGTLPAPPVAGPLRAALRAAEKAGPLERGAAGARARAVVLEHEIAAAMAQLQPAPRQRDAAVDALPVPARAVVDAALETGAEVREAWRRHALEADRADRAAAALGVRRVELGAEAELPTPQRVAGARAGRDATWRHVRAALEDPAGVPGGEALEHASRFEDAVVEADLLADERAERADALAAAATLHGEELRLQADRRTLEESAGVLREREAAWKVAWSALWAPVLDAPPLPEAADAWLEAWQRACGLTAELRAGVADADAAEAEAERHRAALASRLAEAGEAAPHGAGLDALAEHAHAAAERLDTAAAARRRAEDDRARAAEALEEALAAQQVAEAQHEAWTAAWREGRAGCGLAEDLDPDHAEQVLGWLEEAREHAGALLTLRARAATLRRAEAAFGDEVARLCAAIAPDLEETPPPAAARALTARLAEAQRAAEALDGLEARLAEQEEARDAAASVIAASEAELAALQQAAGVRTEDELEDVERAAARARELDALIAALEQQVAEAGEGTFADLAATAQRLDVDTMAAELTGLERRAADLQGERDRAHEQAFAARAELDAADHSDEAGRIAAEAEQHLAVAQQLAERYAVLKLAARVLRDTVERYRAEHQDPLLSRAGQLFPRLTCGAYDRLYADLDAAGEPVLKARTSAGVPHGVEQMSDGTREQLFLALRVAGIERYVEASGPLPVVFDDVFLESDNARSERIFEVLSELAQRTQVIVLTHHLHLVGLAQGTIDPTRLDLLDLQGDPVELTAAELPAPGLASG